MPEIHGRESPPPSAKVDNTEPKFVGRPPMPSSVLGAIAKEHDHGHKSDCDIFACDIFAGVTTVASVRFKKKKKKVWRHGFSHCLPFLLS